MNITILLGTGATLQATIDPASVKPYGIGGSTAKATTIGQGVTGLSTMSLQSILAASAIVAGAVLALGRLMRSV